MEAVHKHESFWKKEEFSYIRIVEISKEELNIITKCLSRIDIIEWLMWNDPNGVYSDESSLREFGQIMTREEGLEIMLRQAEENNTTKNLYVI
jgi:hypothetical protein